MLFHILLQCLYTVFFALHVKFFVLLYCCKVYVLFHILLQCFMLFLVLLQCICALFLAFNIKFVFEIFMCYFYNSTMFL